MARRIIDREREIRLDRGGQALFDNRPRREQIAQTHDAVVVSEGRAQERRAAIGGGNARRDGKFDVGIARGQFEHGGRHAVDAGVAAAHERDAFSFGRQVETERAAFDFARHAGRTEFLAGKRVSNELDVLGIADDDVARFDCRDRLTRHEFARARPDSYDPDYVSHVVISIPCERLATANVTPSTAVLRKTSS